MREFARVLDPPSHTTDNRSRLGQTSSVSSEKHCPMDSAFSSRMPGKPIAATDKINDRPTARVSAIALQAIRQRLDPHSLDLLHFLLQFRVATTDQLRRRCYWDRVSKHAGELACWRALHRLQEHQLINCLPRRAGGLSGGSIPAVWYLTNPGYRLILLEQDNPTDAWHTARVRISQPPALFTLHHRLAVTETYVRLHELKSKGQLDVFEFETEPACWRQFYGPGGSKTILKPDASARVAAHGSEFERLWFLEIDMGSESQATIQHKASVYEAYRRIGVEQAQQGVFPKVMWITATEQREQQLNALFHSNYCNGSHEAIRMDQFTALAGET